MNRPIDCKSIRRFGVEIELNTFDGDIKKTNIETKQIPTGMDYIACLVKEASRDSVQIVHWSYIHNNEDWVIKYDMSCGIEINTPVFKGWNGLNKLLRVVESLSNDEKIEANELCSLHVHVSVSDLNAKQMASVIAHYLKCEHVFFDSIPEKRKNNRYCQCIGMTDWFDTNFDMDAMDLITQISQSKYGSINAFHFVKGGGFSPDNERRQTLEFRIAENSACLDPFYVKNWIRLLLHFIEVTKNRKIPQKYIQGNQNTGLAWLDFEEVYKLLKFDQDLSLGMQQVRQWFMGRIEKNQMKHVDNSSVWSSAGRSFCNKQFSEINLNLIKIEEDENSLYGNKYII